MEIFVVQEQEQPWDKWGGYGHILIHGMTRHIGRKDGLLQLERTGPFVPPISFPGFDIVITQATKRQLENNLYNLRFIQVHKARIVEIDWHLWELSSDDPPTLIIHGDYDPIPVDDIRLINRAINNSQITIIEDCGVLLHRELERAS